MGISLVGDVRPISYIKTHAARVLSYINESKNPVTITQNGEARGVILDIESYRKITDALILILMKLSPPLLKTAPETPEPYLTK
jgi:prevent-host-death family protein